MFLSFNLFFVFESDTFLVKSGIDVFWVVNYSLWDKNIFLMPSDRKKISRTSGEDDNSFLRY